jgi:hypothetical protein
MLKLDLSTDPRWLELSPGVRVRLLPLTTALMVTTRNDPSIEALPEDASNEDRALVFAKALGRRAVVEWEGVGDMDGNVLDLTPKGVDALLDIYPIFEAFQAGYVAKALVLDQEKNVSAPLLTGTSAGAIDTARLAKPSRLAKPARPAKSRAQTARKK